MKQHPVITENDTHLPRISAGILILIKSNEAQHGISDSSTIYIKLEAQIPPIIAYSVSINQL